LLIDFVRTHLPGSEQERLLAGLEHAHGLHTPGLDVLQRLEHLVMQHLDVETARRYYEVFVRRRANGEPLVRA
jgi:hypothetical protein